MLKKLQDTPRLISRAMTTAKKDFAVHTEGKAKIYLPVASTSSAPLAPAPEGSKAAPKNVFVNPVQEFNRDISIVAIRTWSEIFAREKLANWEKKQAKKAARGLQDENGRGAKRRKGEDGQAVEVDATKTEAVCDLIYLSAVQIS